MLAGKRPQYRLRNLLKERIYERRNKRMGLDYLNYRIARVNDRRSNTLKLHRQVPRGLPDKEFYQPVVAFGLTNWRYNEFSEDTKWTH